MNMRLAKNIFFLCFIILPSLAHAQTWRFFAELHYSTMLQFNYIEPGKTLTKKEINEYYFERLASFPSWPIKVGVEYKKHHFSIHRQSNNHSIKGVFQHKGVDFHDKTELTSGGGLDFVSTQFSTGLKYGYEIYKKNRWKLMSTVAIYYFRKIDDRFTSNSTAWRRVGNVGDQTIYKLWNSDDSIYKGFRPIIGLEGQYNITKRKSIGINLQYHFPTSQKVFQRDITVIDRKTGEHHNFQHVNYGRALDISVFFKYNFAEIKSFKTIRDPLGSRQKYKG